MTRTLFLGITIPWFRSHRKKKSRIDPVLLGTNSVAVGETQIKNYY